VNAPRRERVVWRDWITSPSGIFALLAIALLLLLWWLEEPWSTRAARRLARGVSLKPIDHVQLWFWWGVLGNALLCAALSATARFWIPLTMPRPQAASPAPRPSRIFLLAVAGILIAAALLRAPALDHTMLRDESDTAVRNVHGVSIANPDGFRTFRPAGWIEALWENNGANNPVLFSILSHAGLDLWRAATGAPRDRFDPRVLRWPSFAAGILACGMLAFLGQALAKPLTGLAAGLLLALHPWHIRYSVEGRGYALNLLCILLALLCLVRAAQTGSWKWWAGWGGALFAALYSFPGSIYLAAVTTVAAIVHLALRPDPRPVRIAQIAKLLIANTVSAGLYLLLMVPCAPQILAYLERSTAKGPMGTGWWAEWIGCLTTGLQLGIYEGHPPRAFGVVYDVRKLPEHPLLLGFSEIAIPALWFLGILLLCRRAGPGRLIACAGLLSPLLAWGHNRLTGNYLYPWYLIFFLPFTLLFIGAALEGLTSLVRAPKVRIAIWFSLLAIYSGIFLYVSHEPRERLARVSSQPYVAFARGKYEDRIYREGWITRHVRPEWLAHHGKSDADSPTQPTER